jgi:hypothetical protein
MKEDYWQLYSLNTAYHELKNEIEKTAVTRNHQNMAFANKNDGENTHTDLSVLPSLSAFLPNQFPLKTQEEKQCELKNLKKKMLEQAQFIQEQWRIHPEILEEAKQSKAFHPLSLLVFAEDVDLIRNLIKDGLSPTGQEDEMISNAILSCNQDMLSFLVEELGFAVDYTSDDSLIGELSTAITGNNIPSIEYLVKHGAPLQAHNNGALMYALRVCNFQAFKTIYELIEKKEQQKSDDYKAGGTKVNPLPVPPKSSPSNMIFVNISGMVSNNVNQGKENEENHHFTQNVPIQYQWTSTTSSIPIMTHHVYIPQTMNQLIDEKEFTGILKDWLNKEVEWYQKVREWQNFSTKYAHAINNQNKADSNSNSDSNKNHNNNSNDNSDACDNNDEKIKEQKALMSLEVIIRHYDDINNMYAIVSYMIEKGYRINGNVIYSMLLSYQYHEDFFAQDPQCYLDENEDNNNKYKYKYEYMYTSRNDDEIDINNLQINKSQSLVFESEKALFYMMKKMVEQKNEATLFNKLLTTNNAQGVFSTLTYLNNLDIGLDYQKVQDFYEKNHQNWNLESEAVTGSRAKIIMAEKNPASLGFLRFILEKNPQFESVQYQEQDHQVDLKTRKSNKI